MELPNRKPQSEDAPRTRKRTILRVALTLALVTLLGWGVLTSWDEMLWHQARNAIEDEDHVAAETYLQKLLKLDPQHAAAHRAYAEVRLELDSAEGVPPTFAANSAAREHLGEAARLLPEDVELQKLLLRAQLGRFDLPAAAAVAEKVIAAEPQNADALYALTWRAVQSNSAQEAEQLFDRFREVANRRPFRTLALMARFYDSQENPKLLDAVVDQAAQVAGQIDAELLGSFGNREFDAMNDLLKMAIDRAPDAETAARRVEILLAANEKLLQQERREPAQVAKIADDAIVLWEQKHPASGQDPAQQQARDNLRKRARQLRDTATASRDA